MKKIKDIISDYENYMDSKGSEFELLIIVIFWVLIFDPLVFLVTWDFEWVKASQILFIVFILIPYILWRTKPWKKAK